MEGAKTVCAAFGIAFSVLGDTDYIEQAAKIVENAKEKEIKPAFLCSGDSYAGYIILNLQKRGFFPGVDFGIMGFDRLELMQMLPVSLASVENNVEQIGKEAINQLLNMIDHGGRKRTVYVPYQIIDGKTL